MSQETNAGREELNKVPMTLPNDAFESPEPPAQGENPIAIVRSRLYGRWKPILFVGAVLSPIFAWLGYVLAPVTFQSTSVLVVESSLPALVEETLETERIIEFDAFVMEKAQQMKTNQVFLTAFEDPTLKAFEGTRPNYREEVFSDLNVSNPKRSSLVLVSYEDKDPDFAAAAVNSVVKAYRKIYAPDPLAEYKAKADKINELISESRSRLSMLRLSKSEVSIDVRYGRSDPAGAVEENVLEIRDLELEIARIDGLMKRIREQVGVDARVAAERENREVEEAELQPKVTARLQPGSFELAAVDPLLESLETELEQLRITFEVTSRRFGEGHMSYRTVKANYDSKQSAYEGRVEAAKQTWFAGPGKALSTWGGLIERKRTVEGELKDLIDENIAFEKVLIQMDEFDGKIRQEIFELAKLEERITDLSRERSTIGEGRIRFPISDALPAFAPTKDKRVLTAVGGFVGGWGLAVGFFFLLGTSDQKTFGVCQLKTGGNNLHVLGVLPNLDDVGGESDSVMLASDCIHRIRSRIEARRAPEPGYTLMVSSPFQGDGKTTLAVSLAWSYAESGYRTLIIDADFVGRAMTHQFGRLKESGLREVVRRGRIEDEIVELGHPNLRLLGVGFDRRVSAANVSPKVFAGLIESIRDQFDVIIFDSGPFAASIEAYPLASVVDGIVLTLRRGRSRVRLLECVKDIRAIGADYLGVVLNYADKTDCQRYGSTSKVSAGVAEILVGDDVDDEGFSKHPLIGDLTKRPDESGDR